MSDPLHTLVIERRDGVVVATLNGEIDASNADLVRAPLIELAPRRVIVDLTAVRYLDSAGIAMLDAVRRRTEVRLVIARNSTIARALEITGLTQLMNTYPSVDAALTATS
jgi:anti-sigma B factor antagonist